jgi:16S rRNA C967 or C1407 C5-methylase (RsmB/RsmF family)
MASSKRRPGPTRSVDQRKRDVFLDRTAAALGLPSDEIEQRFRPGDVHGGRVNRLKAPAAGPVYDELADAGVAVTPLPWYPDGATFAAAKGDVAALPAVTEGRFFVQNVSSFLPPLALGARPGDAVLDTCAAPGGKASLVAALTGGAADLWLNDGIATRIPRLRDVERTLGFAAATVTTHPAQYIDKYVDRDFDRILVDAQCSGEGLLDLSRPTAFRYWSLARIRRYHFLQTKMLVAAFRLLRPGGVLVYSTCTVAPEENEAPVSTLLAREPDAAVEPLRLDDPAARPGLLRWDGERYAGDLGGALRLVPERGFEAFFACRIRRLGPGLARAGLAEVDLGAVGRSSALPDADE